MTNMNRREFLTLAAVGGAGALMEACKGWNDSKPKGIDRPHLVEKQTGQMPPGFSRFEIRSKNDRELGDIYFMDEPLDSKERQSHAALLGKGSHPELFTPLDFDKVKQHYEKQNKHPALIVSGAFTPDWKNIQGRFFENGKNIGEANPAGYQGLLVVKGGVPKIMNMADVDKQTFWKDAEKNKWSVLQQMQVIKNGKKDIDPSRINKDRLRFYVERKASDGQQFGGVVNFTWKMSLKEAADFLDDMGSIENALYLDTGPVSEGRVYTASGQEVIQDEQFGTDLNKYTNLLVLYGEKNK